MKSFFPSVHAEINFSYPYVNYILEGRKLSFHVRDIRMVGEFTTAPDNLETQYFFVFQLRGQDNMVEVPAFCDDLFQVLTELKASLPGMTSPKLQISEGNDSNILFPERLAGKKLYRFRKDTCPLINVPLLRNIGSVEEIKRTRINH